MTCSIGEALGRAIGRSGGRIAQERTCGFVGQAAEAHQTREVRRTVKAHDRLNPRRDTVGPFFFGQGCQQRREMAAGRLAHDGDPARIDAEFTGMPAQPSARLREGRQGPPANSAEPGRASR